MGEALLADRLFHELRLMMVALQFLTRIPVPSFNNFELQWLSASLRYFPVIGFMVAAVQCLLWSGLVQILPHSVAVALVMGAGLMLTGGFHEDGWADVCDGMGGGYTADKVLSIMKDSRIGAFAGMGLVWMLLSKWSTLSYLSSAPVFCLALLWSHGLSRLAATSLIVTLMHVGDAQHSKTKPLGEQMSWLHWTVSAALLLILSALALVIAVSVSSGLDISGAVKCFALCCLMAGLAATLCARYFRRRIGGYTGDCLGATQQVAELTVYLTVLASWGPSWVT
jgi:adenosylcobinamide-GDP ribazoletransferase